MPDRVLEGQTALVTGAGRGLGRAFAERLASLGCNIAVHGMREHGPSEYGGRETLSDVARSIAEVHRVRTVKVLADLTRSADVERVVATASRDLGAIDILVHNAGGDIAAAGGKPDPNDVVHIKEEDVRAVIDRNLLSTIFVCQQVARAMLEYWRLGIHSFLIRGFDPFNDTIEFGRELIPRLRAGVAELAQKAA